VAAKLQSWSPVGLDGVEAVLMAGDETGVGLHSHRSLTVGVLLCGRRCLQLGGTRIIHGPGEVVVVAAREPHSLATAGCGPWTWAAFCIVDTPSRISGVIHDPRLASHLLELHHASRSARPVSAERITNLLDQLPRATGRGGVPAAVAQVRETIEADPAGTAALDELARVAGWSRFHLARQFRRHTGLTPQACRILARLREARRLIAAGKSLAQAAAGAGFSDQSHLCRWFRRLVGVSPGCYRPMPSAARERERGWITPASHPGGQATSLQ
jgi:AraC-like DNA-binding protein